MTHFPKLIVFPGGPLPLPRTWPVRSHELAGGQILDADPYADDLAPNDESRFDETYLRLLDVDLDSEDSILEFVDSFGILGVRRRRFREFRDFPHFDQVLERLRASWPFAVNAKFEAGDGQLDYGETFEEFRFGASVIRDMVMAYGVLSGAWPLEQAVFESGMLVEKSEYALRQLLCTGLNGGLEAFHPRVDPMLYEQEAIVDPDSLPTKVGTLDELESMLHDAEASGSALTKRGDVPVAWERHPIAVPWTLYSICCLQLYNHIAMESTHRRCANETCENVFVHQRSVVEKTRDRSTGIKYCSDLCRRAQASRRYRRKQSAANAEGG